MHMYKWDFNPQYEIIRDDIRKFSLSRYLFYSRDLNPFTIAWYSITFCYSSNVSYVYNHTYILSQWQSNME